VVANAVVSHLHLADDAPKRLKELEKQIMHVHLSDNNGKVHGDLPPGKGTAPLKEYLRVLKGMGYDGTVTIELEFSPDPDRIKEWVKESYDVTAEMMSDLGIRKR
jgi:D-psicose/D-tagatose/L-ribulose 3-epimerase